MNGMKQSTMKQVIFYIALILVTILIFIPKVMAKEDNNPTGQQEKRLFEFKNTEAIEYWRIVNDGVMGGLSRGKFTLSNYNTAVFMGIVSLENNAGFTSVRTMPRSYGLDGYHGILLRVKGDGKEYQFRLRTDNRFDGISYQYKFKTKDNAWMTVKVPFNECIPVFRGRIQEGVKPVVPEEIQQIGFLISNKRAKEFQLEIDWIKAYKN
jgi:NADH dehydrogenase [ubiquinone] 1 alpha subcomplex assembly factor 1